MQRRPWTTAAACKTTIGQQLMVPPTTPMAAASRTTLTFRRGAWWWRNHAPSHPQRSPMARPGIFAEASTHGPRQRLVFQPTDQAPEHICHDSKMVFWTVLPYMLERKGPVTIQSLPQRRPCRAQTQEDCFGSACIDLQRLEGPVASHSLACFLRSSGTASAPALLTCDGSACRCAVRHRPGRSCPAHGPCTTQASDPHWLHMPPTVSLLTASTRAASSAAVVCMRTRIDRLVLPVCQTGPPAASYQQQCGCAVLDRTPPGLALVMCGSAGI